jgi:hypothetical protein
LNLSRKLVNLVYLVYFAFIFTIFKYVTLNHKAFGSWSTPQFEGGELKARALGLRSALESFSLTDLRLGGCWRCKARWKSWHLFFCDSPGIHPSSYAWTSLPMAFWRSTSFLVKAVAYPENSCNIT